MKKIFLLPFLSVAFLTLTLSCENDITVTDDWQDVTIVYSLLDPAADTNWVRVERGYLGTAPARQSFGIPDSLYYDSLVVYLLAYENGNMRDSLYLQRDDTSRERDSGLFTSENFRLYRTTEPISSDYTYELNVKKISSKFTDAKATTEIVGSGGGVFDGFTFIKPSTSSVTPLFNGLIETGESDNASIYQMYITLNYKEFDINTKLEEMKSIRFLYNTLEGAAAQQGGKVNFDRPFNSLYLLIASEIPVDETKLRFFEDMEFEVYAGASSFQKYMALSKPTSGINQTKPEFPGIENGTGLFSSRTSIVLDNIVFANVTLEESFMTSGPLCDRRFAKVYGNGDTVICKSIPGLGRELKPYDE